MISKNFATVALTFASLSAGLALAACGGGKSGPRPSLLNPSPAELAQPAPDSFKVKFETSKGAFTVMAYRAWSPLGTDRFYFLVSNGFYDGVHFFRTIPNFVVQFGLNGSPEVNKAWEGRTIKDEPVKQSNQPGFISYAKGGPDTRTTQIFINKVDNSRLDAMGFSPFAKIIDGMHVVEQFYGGYANNVPDQGRIRNEGNAYLDREYSKLDSIVTAKVIK